MLDTKMCQTTNSYYLEGFWLNGARWIAKENSIDEIQNDWDHSTKLPMFHLMIEKHDGSKLGAGADFKESTAPSVLQSKLNPKLIKAGVIGRI